MICHTGVHVCPMWHAIYDINVHIYGMSYRIFIKISYITCHIRIYCIMHVTPYICQKFLYVMSYRLYIYPVCTPVMACGVTYYIWYRRFLFPLKFQKYFHSKLEVSEDICLLLHLSYLNFGRTPYPLFLS